MKISIIMPAYNEEKRIGDTLNTYSKYFEGIRKSKFLDYEILVVINNTKDRTINIVESFKKKNKRVAYLNLKKGGKGYAIVEGFKDSLKRENDLIGFVDADMATPPEAFYKLVENVKGYDGAIASRWVKGSVIKVKQTLLRRFMSIGFNFLVRSMFLMHYRDTQCGAKIFKREIIKFIINKIGITKWAFDVNLLYEIRKNGFKLVEVKTIWEDKKDSKLNVTKVPFEMFSGIARLRLINSPFNFVVRFYDLLPEVLKLYHR